MSSGKSPSLVVRADASLEIGAGHVMRCIALAQAWQATGGDVHFVCAELLDGIANRLADENFNLTRISADIGSAGDAVATREIMAGEGGCLILDGYQFNSDYQQAVKQDAVLLGMIDDYSHLDDYVSDVLLNQNLSVSETLYPRRSAHTRLLLGSKYVLLRKEFVEPEPPTRDAPEIAHRVLITLGGSDPENATLAALGALSQLNDPRLQARVVVGPGNPHYRELCDEASRAPFDLRLECNTPDMPELMAWADVAISAAGSTCWELAGMGVPHLVLVLADNQLGIAEALDRVHGDVNLGWFHSDSEQQVAESLTALMYDQPRRQRMIERGRQLIDGHGARRVVQVLQEAYGTRRLFAAA